MSLMVLATAAQAGVQSAIQNLLSQADSLTTEDPEAALAIYKRVYLNCRAAGDWPTTLEAGTQAGILEQKLGHYRQAGDLLREMLQMLPPDAPYDTLTLANAWHKLGVSYYFADQYRPALQSLEKALRLREQFHKAPANDIIKGYHNIGDCYYLLGDYEQSEAYLLQSLQRQTQPPTPDIAKTYRVLSMLYNRQGDIQKAKQYLELAIAYYENELRDNPLNLASTYNNFAVILLNGEAENAVEALPYLQKALAIYESQSKLPPADQRKLANCRNNLGYSFYLIDSLKTAEQHYRQALRIFQQLEPQSREVAAVWNNLGLTALKGQYYVKAQQHFETALALNHSAGTAEDLADNLHNLGDLYAAQMDWTRAADRYVQSIQQILPGWHIDLPINWQQANTSNPKALLTYCAAYGKALLHQQQVQTNAEQLHSISALFIRLSDYLDQTRRQYRGMETREMWSALGKPIYEQAIQAALYLAALENKEANQELAFAFAEKSKGLLLLESISDTRAKAFAGLPKALLMHEEQLREQLGWMEKEEFLLQSSGEDPAGLQAVKDSIVQLSAAYEAFLNRIEQEYPAYFRLKYETGVQQVSGIRRQLLRPEQALIEYFVGSDFITRFVVTGAGLEVQTLPLANNLAGKIDSLRKSIYWCRTNTENGGSCNYWDQVFAGLGFELHQLLLSNLPESNSWIIIPDDVLGYLPFEVLLKAPVARAMTGRYSDYPWVLRDKTISYSYSASLLWESRQAARSYYPAKTAVLAYAPSFSGLVQTPWNRSEMKLTRGQLGPLFFNEPEIESIAKTMRSKTFSGQNATKSSFLEQASKYRYLHLSTHGVMNDRLPQYSYLAFTQTGDSLDFEALLFAGDLYNMSLQADLVVLSACETGVGRLSKGEGIMSLARAFSYAGASSLVTSLWSVNDQQTAALMTAFYDNLAKGMQKDAALQQAKLSLIHSPTGSHPFYWAGFIPIGDMTAIETGTRIWSFWWAGLWVLFGAAGIWLVRAGARRRGRV